MSDSFSGTPLHAVEGTEAPQKQISGRQIDKNTGQKPEGPISGQTRAGGIEQRRIISRIAASELCIEYGKDGEKLRALEPGLYENREARPRITRLLTAARAEAIFSKDDWGVAEPITADRPVREGEQISVRVNGINPVLLDHIGLGELKSEDIRIYAGMTLDGKLILVPQSDTQRIDFGSDGTSIVVEFTLPIQEAYFYKKERAAEGLERTLYGTIVGVTIPKQKGIQSFPVWVDFDAETANQLGFRQAALEASQALNLMLRKNRKAD